VHGEGDDDADAGVVGVGDVLAGAQSEGLLVSLERLVAGVWGFAKSVTLAAYWSLWLLLRGG
jgi:hypothetical protein